MKSIKLAMRIVAGCLALSLASQAGGQDWPQWRGADRDGKAAEFNAPAQWPDALAQQWQSKVGLGDSTPALVGRKLFVFARQGEDEVTLCLDASSGDELWRDSYAALAIKGPAMSHAGPRSSPTVAEGHVVTLGVGGVLSCLDAATGAVKWRKEELPGELPAYFPSMSPIIVDGLCIAHLGGKDAGAIVAFELASGDERWRWEGDAPSYASPVVMTVDGLKQIVVLTAKTIVGLDAAEGSPRWSHALVTGGRSVNSATPVVIGRTVIFAAKDRGTTAIEIEKQGEGFAAKPLWRNENLDYGFCTPVLNGGRLFGYSGRGSFFCMNAETGETLWHATERGERFGTVVNAGSVIIALGTASELIAFAPSSEGYEQLARIDVADSQVYSFPVVAGDRIYVKDQENLTAWSVAAGR